MTLSAEHLTFLGRYGGLKVASLGLTDGPQVDDIMIEFRARREAEEVKDAKYRDFLLAQASGAVFAHADELRAAFNFQMKVGGSKQMMLDEKHGNQEDEVDTIDVLGESSSTKKGVDKTGQATTKKKKAKKVTTVNKKGKEDIALLSGASRAFDVVADESRRLETATTTRSTLDKAAGTIGQIVVPLFENKQIGEMFYTPLVRARLIPENVVVGKFSQTQRMLDATIEHYKKDLTDGTDPTVDAAGFAKTAVGIGGQVANLITAQFGVDTDAVKTMIEAGVQLMDLAIDGMDSIHHGIETKDVSNLCKQFPKALGSLVAAATGNEMIGKAITAVGTVGGDAVTGLVTAAKSKGRIDPADITNLVKTTILDILGAAAVVPDAPAGMDTVVSLLTDAVGCLDAEKVAKVAKGLKTGNWREVASGVLSMVADVAKAAPKLGSDGVAAGGGTMGDGTSEGLDEASKLVAKTSMLLSLTVSAKDSAEVAAAFEKELPGILAQVVTAATGDEAIGNLVKGNSKAAISLGILMATTAKTGRVDPSLLSTALSNSINAVFDDVETGIPGDVPPVVDTVREDLLKIADKIGGSEDAATLLGPGSVKDKKRAAGKIMLQLLLAAPGTASGLLEATGSEDQQESGKQVLDPAEAVADLMDTVMEKAEEAKGEADEASDKVLADIQAQLDKEYADDATKDAQKLVDQVIEEREQYQEDLKRAMSPDADQKSIMVLIKKMQRDQMILSVAISVGSAGAEVAAQFFAPLAIGKEIIVMIANIAAAVQRAVDLKKVLDAQGWAESAASPYRSAIDNFVRNQAEQLTEYSIKAAMNALRIASEIAATAYPQAKPIATGVSIVQTAVTAGFALAKQADLVMAWKVTKTALLEPENRRAGLKAQRMNPTLAKYAIAYGAYEAKDPVAVKTMNEIGLSNDMLDAQDAGVVMVKSWLESRFKDDGKVAGSWNPETGWEKNIPQPVLTATSLQAAYKEMALGAAPFFPGTAVPAVLVKSKAAPILVKYATAKAAYDKAAKATEALRAPAKKDGATADQKQALLDAVVAELEAGQEAVRLIGLFNDELTRALGAIGGLKLGGPVDRDKVEFRQSAADLLLEYRMLAEDDSDQIEGDMLVPAVEQVRLTAEIAKLNAPPQKLAA